MHINLSPEMEKFVQSKVETGFYSNATEVIRDAIRRMHEEDMRIAAMRLAIHAGDAQLEMGQGVADTPERMQRDTARAKDTARRGKKVSSNLTPQ